MPDKWIFSDGDMNVYQGYGDWWCINPIQQSTTQLGSWKDLVPAVLVDLVMTGVIPDVRKNDGFRSGNLGEVRTRESRVHGQAVYHGGIWNLTLRPKANHV